MGTVAQRIRLPLKRIALTSFVGGSELVQEKETVWSVELLPASHVDTIMTSLLRNRIS